MFAVGAVSCTVLSFELRLLWPQFMKWAMAAFNRQNTSLAAVVTAAMLGFLLLTPKSARTQGVVLPLPTEDHRTIGAQLGPGIVGKALPSTPIEDPSIYFPLREKASIYQITAGPNVGNMQKLSLGKVGRRNGESAWRFQISPSLTGFIRQTPEGDLIIPLWPIRVRMLWW